MFGDVAKTKRHKKSAYRVFVGSPNACPVVTAPLNTVVPGVLTRTNTGSTWTESRSPPRTWNEYYA